MSIDWKYLTLYYLLSQYPGIVQQKQVLSRSDMDMSQSCPFEMDYNLKRQSSCSISSSNGRAMGGKSCEEKIEAMLSVRQQVHVEVAGNIKKAHQTQSKYYNRIHNTKPLKIRQKVLKRNLKEASRKEKLV